jgi:predicted O-methyltransferase YrrM
MFPHPILNEIYTDKTLIDGDGQTVPLHSHIIPENVHGLYNAIWKERPRRAIEVGMAYGISSLTILAALEKIGGEGTLTSIDPFQTEAWRRGGLKTVERAGLSHRHRFIEEYDYLALPKLIEQVQKFDFAYIDGYHSFDYVLVDFFMIDLLLEVNGVVGFNDCGWRSVFKVIRFLQTHKKYEEIDVGIKPRYRGRNFLHRSVWRFLGCNVRDRYFRKLAEHKPANNFYARF